MVATKRGGAPPREAVPDVGLYDRDLHAWSRRQVDALVAGRVDELDLANLAEEIADVGHEQFDKLESAYRIILLHMLKWDHQPERRSRSWTLSIASHRLLAEKTLERNPSLRPRRGEALTDAFRRARLEAAGEMDVPLKRLPGECPYALAEVEERPFRWSDED